LGAESAILRARAGLGIDDGTKVDLIAFELFPDAIRPRKQVKYVRRTLQLEQFQGFLARELAAAQHTFAKLGYSLVNLHVNVRRSHC